MPDEKIIVADTVSEVSFNLFWYGDHHDLLVQENRNGEVSARIMFVPEAEGLRELAEQFYKWADMLDQINHDRMDTIAAELKRAGRL